jgi:hypothetical protein
MCCGTEPKETLDPLGAQPLSATQIQMGGTGWWSACNATCRISVFCPLSSRARPVHIGPQRQRWRSRGNVFRHGAPVKTDELADVYSRRDFRKGFAALAKPAHGIGTEVPPSAGGAFAAPRGKESANISRAKVDRIAELYAAGLRLEEIAG